MNRKPVLVDTLSWNWNHSPNQTNKGSYPSGGFTCSEVPSPPACMSSRFRNPGAIAYPIMQIYANFIRHAWLGPGMQPSKKRVPFRMLGYVGWMPSKHLIDSWFSWKRARQVLSSSCAASTASISDEKNIPNIPVHWDPSMPWSPGVLKCRLPKKKKRFFASSPCHQYPLSIHHWTCTYPSLTPMAPAFLGGSFEVVFIWDLFLNPQRIRSQVPKRSLFQGLSNCLIPALQTSTFADGSIPNESLHKDTNPPRESGASKMDAFL